MSEICPRDVSTELPGRAAGAWPIASWNRQGIDEIVAQNTYWFGLRFAEFRGQTDKLPCDQHWLLALAAPRPFILCNALDDQYGSAIAAAESYHNAKPVYALLGVPDWKAILDFSDQQLRTLNLKRRFDQLPPADQLH
jgi:hypothetical protein